MAQYRIWMKGPCGVELVDTATSKREARFMLGEYRLAWASTLRHPGHQRIVLWCGTRDGRDHLEEGI